ncbi:uncharacterized protein LOC111717357 [Eurytemora carolleeae]|uniref:uncharacterized protein LOC111717357 n=1 Tax=Eurytemora carolleeae TaxID=1294199 RepID=UPI000C76CEEF|nr:uncharacterized protein LOC111717357 [Eurytemora carolleeae]|eukprot:XP_023348657.1 uncharacterized protein LOC111717357 [Eurytemora affinis]
MFLVQSWSGEENLEKKKSEWEFTPAEGATEEPSFRIHIVQDYRTFWVDILVTPSTHQGEDVERFAPVTEGSEVYDFSGERELSGEPGLNGDPELNGEFSGDGEQLEVPN